MGSTTGSAPLVGRAAELDLLTGRLADLGSGRGSSVLIEGEAGIGKTALVQEVLKDAAHRGFEICSGRGEELEGDRPFGPLIAALGLTPSSPDPLRARIAGLLGDQTGGRGPRGLTRAPELRFRIMDAIVELLEERSTTERMVVCLEDLHWADASTLLTVKRLASLVTQLQMVLLLTARAFPRTKHLLRLIESLNDQDVVRMDLEPLDSASLSRLVEELFGSGPGPVLRRQLEATGGNPLFATELLNTLATEKAIDVGDDQVETTESEFPPSLRLTILRRLSFLDDETLEVLKVASVLGSSFSMGDLSIVMEQPLLRLAAVLQRSMEARLIDESDDRFVFRHELIRHAVYLDLPLAVRKDLHLAVARALAAAGRTPLKVATHFVVAAPSGDRQAIEWLQAAARDAVARDPFTAVSLLEHARDLAPEPEKRVEILVELLAAYTWAGQETDAIETAERLLERDQPPAVEVATRMALANALFFQNRMRESAEQCELAARSSELADTARAAILGRLAAAWVWAEDLERAAVVAAEAVEAGEKTPSDLAFCLGLTNGGWVAFLQGHEQEAIAACTKSAERALGSPDEDAKRAIMAHNSLAFILSEADRVDEAEEALRTGRRVGDEAGRVWDLPLWHNYKGFVRFLRGRWDDAADDFELGISLAEDVETRLGGVFPHSMLAAIATHRNELAEAEEALGASARHSQTWGLTSIESYYDAWAKAQLLEARGAPQDALRLLIATWDKADTLGVVSSRRVLGPDLVRLALLTDDKERARVAAQGVSDAACLGNAPSLRGASLLCGGLVEEDPDMLLEAVAEYRRSPRVVETARCSEEAGRVLHLAERRDEGESLLDEAVEVYEQVGAFRDRARVNAFLRSQGVRRGARTRHRQALTGWDSLTPSEEKVVSLVAEGLSNPQIATQLFISRHTVESHVSHILAKMGVSSRVELAARWARRDYGIE